MRKCSFTLLVLLATTCPAQTASTSQLLVKLTLPESTYDAVSSLCEMSQQDAATTAAVVDKLPALLQSAIFTPHANPKQQPLYALADLAGCLHLASAVPPLVERLTQRTSNERTLTFLHARAAKPMIPSPARSRPGRNSIA